MIRQCPMIGWRGNAGLAHTLANNFASPPLELMIGDGGMTSDE